MQARKVTYIIAAVIAALLIFSILGGGAAIAPAAVTTSATPVLDDLQQDESFNAADYPEISDDYSIQVIQIAESTDGELLIYTYQPSGTALNLRASLINISRQPKSTDNLKFRQYSLERLNANGVFFKYKVLDFTLDTAAVRYYSISNILRPFDGTIDKDTSGEGLISAVPNRVAQFWTAATVGDSVAYSMETSEVITITQKVVGYCFYDDGLNLGWGAMEGITKAYFVAFDTDRPIDKLISADLIFFATRAHCKVCCNDKHDHGYFYDFHDPEYIDFGTGVNNDEPLTITDKQTWGNQGGGNVRPATKFLKKRIRKTEEFISDGNNKDYELEAGDSLNGTKWVLNFYEAQDRYKVDNVWLSFIPLVTNIKGVADGEAELNNVYDVEILRLEFETDGITYNLGVVDNKQSPSNKPVNSIKDNGGCGGCGSCSWLTVLPWWAWLLIIFLAPVIIFLLFKLLVWLVTLPFKAVNSKWKKRKAAPAKPKRNAIRRKTKRKKAGKKK